MAQQRCDRSQLQPLIETECNTGGPHGQTEPVCCSVPAPVLPRRASKLLHGIQPRVMTRRPVASALLLLRVFAADNDLKIPVALPLATFVIANIAYSYFYSSLGVALGEVGLDFQTLLSQSWGLMMLAFLLGLLVVGLLRFLEWLVPQSRASGAHGGDPTAAVALLVTVLLPALVIATVIADLKNRIALVREGRDTPPITLLRVPLLDVSTSTVCARASSLEAAVPPFQAPRRLQMLGQNTSVFVLFDHVDGTVLLAPITSLRISKQAGQATSTAAGGC